MQIAMVGTRGVPARYGGFETCVEEVGRRLADLGHDVTVYCRTTAAESRTAPATHLGMSLVHLPAPRRKSIETLAHTALSVAHLARHRVDAALVFNAANAPLLPVLRARGIPVATHVDGLEWKRAKWGRIGQQYYRRAEVLAVRWSDALIADAGGIADYYRQTHGVETDQIAYGAPILTSSYSHRLAELGLTKGGYHLVVARFEPENHVDVIVDGHARSGAHRPLVVVGGAPYLAMWAASLPYTAELTVRRRSWPVFVARLVEVSVAVVLVTAIVSSAATANLVPWLLAAPGLVNTWYLRRLATRSRPVPAEPSIKTHAVWVTTGRAATGRVTAVSGLRPAGAAPRPPVAAPVAFAPSSPTLADALFALGAP
jgi:glycosyltransferase involved in cell wall biosynthesis